MPNVNYNLFNNNMYVECKPFVKWAGGKSQLIGEITKYLPHKFNTYFEPFLGGGALFFHLQPSKGIISDINPELINLYKVVKLNVEELIEDLKTHKHEENYYYKLRNVDRIDDYKNWSKIKRASRFIYLNKTCYNGLYRVNSKGYFNAPFGSYKNPKIVDETNLRACSIVLKDTEIILSDFTHIKKKIKNGDFVYFDPPYKPLNKTSSFTKYFKDDFDEKKQIVLKELCDFLTKQGVYFMLSNSYTDMITEIYKNYNINIVLAKRAINSKGNSRGKIKEVLITNYDIGK
ncbi:MAG: DNA adenine methylase [Spirochaetota bacterium]